MFFSKTLASLIVAAAATAAIATPTIITRATFSPRVNCTLIVTSTPDLSGNVEVSTGDFGNGELCRGAHEFYVSSDGISFPPFFKFA